MKRKLLITGAAGLIGRELSRRLRGSFDLILLDRAAIDGEPGDVVVVGDLRDQATLLRAIDGAQAVLHLAYTPGETVTFADTLDVDYRATLALYEAAIVAGAT